MSPLIPLEDKALQAACPGWPCSAWQTGHLIRQGRLGCVRVGRRIMLTRELLEEFITRNTEKARER